MTTPNPDIAALPAALQQQLAGMTPPAGGQPQPQPQNPQPQQAPQPQNPQPQNPQPQQPQQPQNPQQAPAPAPQGSGMDDAELAEFFVDAPRPGQQQPQPVQTYGFDPAPTQQPQGYQPAPQNQPPGSLSQAQLDRIEQAQRMMFEAMRGNSAGQQQAQPQPGPPAPPQQQAAPALEVAIPAVELSDEEKKFLGDKLPVFEKLAAKYAKTTLEPILKQIAERQAQAAQRFDTLENSQRAQQHMTFRQVLSARIPDFETLARQPQFAEFLRQDLPDVGATRADVLRSAINAGNIGLIERHIMSYKQQYGGAGADTTQMLQQPTTQNRGVNPQTAPQAKVVTDDTLMAAERAMSRGLLAPEKFEKLIAIYRAQTQQQAPQGVRYS